MKILSILILFIFLFVGCGVNESESESYAIEYKVMGGCAIEYYDPIKHTYYKPAYISSDLWSKTFTISEKSLLEVEVRICHTGYGKAISKVLIIVNGKIVAKGSKSLYIHLVYSMP